MQIDWFKTITIQQTRNKFYTHPGSQQLTLRLRQVMQRHFDFDYPTSVASLSHRSRDTTTSTTTATRRKFVQHFTHAAVLHKHVRNNLVGIVWCTLAVSYVAWCISLSESLKSGVLWLYDICSMMSCELLSKHERQAECCSLHMSTIVAWHWQIPNCSKNHSFKSFPNDTEGLTETDKSKPWRFPLINCSV